MKKLSYYTLKELLLHFVLFKSFDNVKIRTLSGPTSHQVFFLIAALDAVDLVGLFDFLETCVVMGLKYAFVVDKINCSGVLEMSLDS